MINRRDAIKQIGGLAGAAAMAKYLPGCGGSSGPNGIKNYVFMMMENRSYDHYFGARKLVEGLDGDGLAMTMTNPDLAGNPIAPWNPNMDQMCDLDPPHDWDDAHNSFNNGAMDGFVKADQMDHSMPDLIDPMQYLTRDQLPVSWALADAYTTCDRWFCSVMGPTWPNRFYWHTGSSGGLMSNELPSAGYLPWPSIYNNLMAANVDWAYYYGTIPVLSALNNPGPYQIPDDYLQARVRRFSQFLTDAMAGKLPPVTYIDPAFYQNDDHPPIHPINGQALIATVYTALAKSPHWKNTMLVITYDENGGFFDHVPPPTTADDYTSTGFNQLGFRVPAMIIGPYAKQSYVSSVQYDHTSALKHLTNVFDLPTIQGQLAMRMNAANDLSDTIDMDRLDKDQWAKPVEIPSVDVTQWPMSSACDYNGSRIDPITKWADDNPDKVRGLDLRSELPEYRRTIIEFLREHQGTIGK